MTIQNKKRIGFVIALAVQVAGLAFIGTATNMACALGVAVFLVGKEMSQDVRRLK